MKNKRVLITGGSGYFGELLTKKLTEKNYICTIFDLNEPDFNLFSKKVSFIKGDIRDFESVNKSCKNIDYVFHNVAQVPLAKNSRLFYEVNYIGTENILKASLNNNVEHFVYTSSSAIFGVPKSNPVTELTMPVPGEKYGEAKLHGENSVLEYSKKGLKSSIIRPRTILGGERLGIFQILFEWIYQGTNIPVFDKGNNIYQFIHADDLANAIIASVSAKQTSIFNIGTDRFCSMFETLDYLIKEVNSKSKIRSLNSKLIIPIMKITSKLGFSPLGSYHSMMYGKSMYFDVSKAKNELNWKPFFSNKEMILESYKLYLKNRDSIINSNIQKSAHKSMVKQGALKILSKFL